MTASQWVKSLSMPRKAQTAILHTRYWTQGSPKVNDNNHPIRSGPVVGVHNGTVWNDDALFVRMSKVPRIAEVDSEAIFALLAYGEDYFDVEHDTDLLEEVQGTAAIAYMDINDAPGVLHLARLASSPLVIAQTSAGSLVFASTKEAVTDSMEAVGLDVAYLDACVKEGTYIRVKDGLVTDERAFEYDIWASDYRYRPTRSTITVRTHSGVRDWCSTHSTWADTCEECDPSLADERVTVVHEPDETPAPLRPMEDLHKSLIEAGNLDPTHNVPILSESEWEFAYADRIEDVEEWLEVAESSLDQAEAMEWAVGEHAWTRPSDWVKTVVMGEEVYGQVVDVPREFPGGHYIIRCLVPRDPGKKTESEVAIVARKANDFIAVAHGSARVRAAAKSESVIKEHQGTLALVQ